MSARTVLLDFMRGTHTQPVMVSPLFSDTMIRDFLKTDRELPQDDPEMIEGKLRFAEECGFPPLLKFELYSLDLWRPETTILENTLKRKSVKSSFRTPLGDLTSILVTTRDSGHEEKPLVETIEDVERFLWVQENLADYTRFRRKLRSIIDQIGERGTMTLNIGQPLFYLASPDKAIFLCFDHEKTMKQAIDRHLAVIRRIMDAAMAEGVNCFFASQLSKNMLSPDMVKEWIVPPACSIRQYCREKKVLYYLHECGKMKENIDRGFFHEIDPDWCEGFEQPPMGDIEHLGEIRKKFPPHIVFKGNINNQFLVEAAPAEVEKATRRLLTEVTGYRHIVGAGCSLLRGTPVENVRAMVKAAHAHSRG